MVLFQFLQLDLQLCNTSRAGFPKAPHPDVTFGAVTFAADTLGKLVSARNPFLLARKHFVEDHLWLLFCSTSMSAGVKSSSIWNNWHISVFPDVDDAENNGGNNSFLLLLVYYYSPGCWSLPAVY